MKEMEKKRNRLILLMLLLPLVVALIATGCKKNRDELYQFAITSVTTSDSSSEDTSVPSESESVSETESEVTTETETEPAEETAGAEETTSVPTPKPTKKPTPKPTKKPTPTPKPKITIKGKKTSKKIVYPKLKYTDYLFVGDSRTVGLDDCVSGISSKAKVGAKVDYLKSILNEVTKTRKKNVIFNFGVNDLGNINKYIKVYKSLPKDFIKNNNVIIMSVNPTDGSKYKNWNKDINSFNSKMKKNLPSGVKFLDTNSTLKKEGFSTRDGVHYTTETYKKIAKLTFIFCGDINRKP